MGLIVKKDLLEGYKKLRNDFGFRDEDYFILRRFIVEVVLLCFYSECIDLLKAAYVRGVDLRKKTLYLNNHASHIHDFFKDDTSNLLLVF